MIFKMPVKRDDLDPARFKQRLIRASALLLVLGFLGFTGLLSPNARPRMLHIVSLPSSVRKACSFLCSSSILRIVADPTTEGLYDSKRAMSYEEPWVDK